MNFREELTAASVVPPRLNSFFEIAQAEAVLHSKIDPKILRSILIGLVARRACGRSTTGHQCTIDRVQRLTSIVNH